MANIYGLKFIKIGAVWIFKGGWGQKPLWGGVTFWPVMPIFEFSWAIPVKSHDWKFGLVWLKLEVFEFSGGGGGQKPPIRGLHVTCNARFWTWPSYLNQKSCVKIWFRLVKRFKSYRGNNNSKKKKKKKKQVKPLGFEPPGGGLMIIEIIWNSGNLPYLVVNAYGVNFIKIGGIWFLKGAEAPY